MKKIFWPTIVLLLFGVLSFCKKENEGALDVDSLIAVWKLDRFIDENDNVTDVPKMLISFTENNCVTFFTPCVCGQGQFSLNQFNVSVGITETYERCVGSETSSYLNDMLTAGNQLISGLSGSYSVTNDTLKISSATNETLVFYKTEISDTYNGDISRRLINKFDRNMYYSEETIGKEHSFVYGKWFVYAVVGGFGGGQQLPHIDFIELKRNGIYGVVNNYNLQEIGKFYVEQELNDGRLLLKFEIDSSFVPDSIASEWSYISKSLNYIENDGIILQDAGCLDCYQYYLKKIN